MAVDTFVPNRTVNLAKRRSLLIEIAIVAAIALFLIFALPWMISAFRLNLMGRFLALAIVALGIDLIWGFTGLLSLGHGIFFTLGGYALAMHLKLPQPPGSGLPDFMSLYGVSELPWFWRPFYSAPFSMMAIAVIPAIIAGLLGYVIFRNRIRGVYFSILTQAATIIFFNFFNGQQKLFNGTNGLTDFRSVFGLPVKDNRTQYILYIVTILFVVAAYALCRWLTSGRFGRLLVAIRDDESRVRFTGYNPTGFKILVFAVSGALAGIAGALFTLQSGIVSPNTMNIAFSIEMVIWVAVGGRATLVGAILGAVVVNLAKSLLSEKFPDFWLFFQGGLFLLVVLLLPNGIIGWLRTSGVNLYKQLTGQTRLSTYPSLEEDPEVEYERKNLGD
ncbi:urea ABC transporter permease subunit UrtC [Thermoleptolyngbya oregonensis NK1-22]|uniref:Urea ABC transporter permease subunit UrtC n=1 Tax=Thermoleptolyngbya oregonensis NK1-22 TaxID=2547457 RepID=A0AA96Y350_9CYAN|nr:urea ABC transporter permease subunit UrtC [Thermoleptolyngbya oregonensis]WOB42840.1 urea ABC transporter permease subunit UrtC [Thermoleptolyngbya oregonensis NK1-22]